MLEYTIIARRTAPALATASSARAKTASLDLDTAPQGRLDAFNPAELLLTALAACMLKAIERVLPMLNFSLRSASVRVHGVRQDVPPQLVTIDYELLVDSDESDERLDLLHRNIQKYGTVYNTLAGAVKVSGVIHRADAAAPDRLPARTGKGVPQSVGASDDEMC
jgi:uncharacterized OsmC-like protein